MFQRSRATEAAYEARIDELFSAPQAKSTLRELKVLDRGDVLDLLGFGDLPVYAHESHAIDDGQYNHPLTREQWKKVPQWLDNPALVLERKSDGHLTIIAPEKTADGRAIIIGLAPRAPEIKLSGVAERHLVLTAYAKNRGVMPVDRDLESGHLKPLYIDKRKTPEFYRWSGVNLTSDIAKLRGLNKSLKTGADLVKYRAARPNTRRSRGAQAVESISAAHLEFVEEAARGLLKGFPFLRREVVQTEADLPTHLQTRIKQAEATGQVSAAYDNGTIYYVANMLGSMEAVEIATLHELDGHFGFEQLFGDDARVVGNALLRLGGKIAIQKIAEAHGVETWHRTSKQRKSR